MAKIEDGEVIEGGITCPNCSDAEMSPEHSRGYDYYFCANCGYAESR